MSVLQFALRPRWTPPPCVEELLRKAKAFEGVGQLGDARECYEQCKELEGRNSLVYFRLGKLEQRLKKWHAAEDNFRSAIKCRPEYVEAHYELSKVLFELSSPWLAEKALLDTLQLSPHHTGAISDLAQHYCIGKRFSEALPLFMLYLRLLPHSRWAPHVRSCIKICWENLGWQVAK